MTIPFNIRALTLDEVIAEHGDRIVRVIYRHDSDDVLPELEIKAYYNYAFLTTLRYVSDGKHWRLQAYTADSSEHYPRNEVSTLESHRVLDAVRKMGF